MALKDQVKKMGQEEINELQILIDERMREIRREGAKEIMKQISIGTKVKYKNGEGVMWGGDKKLRGPLKKKITDTTHTFETKGETRKEDRAYFNFIFTSNEKNLVPVEIDDRRYLVIQMGDNKAKDATYFNNMNKQMKNAGYEKLMHTLLHREIKSDLRDIPDTQLKKELKIEALDWLEKWIYQNLQEGFTEDRINEGYFLQKEITRSKVIAAKNAFIPYGKSGYEQPSKTYEAIRWMLKPKENNSHNDRKFIFDKSIVEYRKEFENYMGFQIEWNDGIKPEKEQKTYEELEKEIEEMKDKIEELTSDNNEWHNYFTSLRTTLKEVLDEDTWEKMFKETF